jgi:hypothetical protein
MEPGRLTVEAWRLKMEPRWVWIPVVADSHHLMRIRIFIKVKRWLWICIRIRIRIRIEVTRIRNSDLPHRVPTPSTLPLSP